jgi:DNA helicase-2/ATP-dependent DNA helicase PcrA
MNQEENILTQLNPSQQKAVCRLEGPVIVIAGAGSGKTRVLTYRIAYMLEKGIAPYSILALTFTNKAANEMKERIKTLVSEAKAKAVNMGTFHSVFYRILKIEGEKLGYTKNLTVYDTDDSKNIIKSIVKEMDLDAKNYTANYILSRISAAKSSLLSADDYANSLEIVEADRRANKPFISEIFHRYNTRLKNSDAMDFDDLLYFMNVLLRDFPEMLLKYQQRFRYILVDEYQDTNFAQYMIIKKLAAAHHNLCVVGDDAQSIYAFRGANINNILGFKKDFPEAVEIKLEQNYRSTQNIVNAANFVIKNNKRQIQKEVWTNNSEGEKIILTKSNTEQEEAQNIAFSIFETKNNQHVQNKQFAILYRTNAQSRALEESLIKMGIPYVIYGGLSFYKRKEIKNIIAYFRLAINHYDEESLLRIINYPMRGIGDTTVGKIKIAARDQGVRLWNVVENPALYIPEINNATAERLKDFAVKIKAYSVKIPFTNAYEMGKHIAVSTGIVKELKDDVSEKERLENVEALLDSMKEFTEREPESSINELTGEVITEYFPSLDRYMDHVALLTDEENKEKDEQDRVRLMTIHASKGLEFDYVFISGMEENLFPSSLSLASPAELEEERRLFYVAVTRAKKRLSLSYAQTRYKYGNIEYCEPSRFVDEIPPQLLQHHNRVLASERLQTAKPFYGNNAATPAFVKKMQPVKTLTHYEVAIQQHGTPASTEDIVENRKIYHPSFGNGVVLKVEGSGAEKKAEIQFDTVGKKILLLKFAKLILPVS